MLQIKTFATDQDHPSSIDDQVNAFLATIKSEDVRDIDVRGIGFAVIQYEVKDSWTDMMCGDCKYWDDSGQSDAVSGLCHVCGGRRRFNCKACDKFRDVRD